MEGSRELRAFFGSKIFWSVLVVKLALGAALASYFLRDLFVPFVNYFVESGFANPWARFAELGRLNSFPYPPLMLYLLAAPRLVFDPILPAGTDTVSPLHFFVLRLPLLAGDLAIALLLVRWFPYRVRRVLIFYWASPLVIYISYWHGQLDVIPTALFLGALALIRARRVTPGMVVFGLALATKSHLWAALPFVLLYLVQERGWRAAAGQTAALLAAYAALVLPFLPDPAFRTMVFATEEQTRLYAFQLPVGSGELAILVAPAAIALLWFRFAAYAHRNWDLLMLYLGVLFSVFILLAPPRPGYFLWSLPFLVYFFGIAGKSRANALPYYAYAAGYLIYFLLGSQSDLFDAWQTIAPGSGSSATPLAALVPARATLLENAAFTAMQAALAGIVLNMYLIGVRRNAVYNMRATPYLIGIAGDSGAGKDTLVGLLQKVMDASRLIVINGDDYHRWPRGHENWQVYTHLDVRSNRLHEQFEHAIALRDGNSIVKGMYDHDTGEFTDPQEIEADQFVVFSGLHALSIEPMRRLFDLRVFLDPDEDLRQEWKQRRDQTERGYLAEQVQQALAARAPDREAYVLPQRESADVIFRLWPRDGRLALDVRALNGFEFGRAASELAALPDLSIEHRPFVDSRWQSLRIAGSISAAHLQTVAEHCLQVPAEIPTPLRFEADHNGLLQLIFLLCLADKLRWSSGTMSNEQ